MKLVSVLALAAAALAAVPASAGTLIVSGDATIAAHAAQAVSTGNPALAGNLTFQQNILGGGDTVSIYKYSVVTTYPNPPLGDQLANVYNGFDGVSASTFDTPITDTLLAGSDLLVILGRSNAYTAGETDAIRNFLYGGGNVLLAGEASNVGTGVNNLFNTLLTDLGSTLRITGALDSPGDQFATGAQIGADPLTAGVTSFGYGYTSRVSGGTTLFTNSAGNAFVAAEQIAAVPEPATWAMMISGFGFVGGALRGRKRESAVLAA